MDYGSLNGDYHYFVLTKKLNVKPMREVITSIHEQMLRASKKLAK